MIFIFATLAVIAAIGCFLTERVDRPMRRAERLAAEQALREVPAATQAGPQAPAQPRAEAA